MRILYLGPEIPECLEHEEVVHCPLLRFAPNLAAVKETTQRWNEISHLIFTSKVAVRFSFELLPSPLPHQKIISIGGATAKRLRRYGFSPHLIAKEQTAEGVIAVIEPELNANSFVCWPHSARSRNVIPNWLSGKGLSHLTPEIYSTHLVRPNDLPCLSTVDAVYFTSPSTVAAFWKVYGYPPKGTMVRAIGPITESYLRWQLQNTAPSETIATCATMDV